METPSHEIPLYSDTIKSARILVDQVKARWWQAYYGVRDMAARVQGWFTWCARRRGGIFLGAQGDDEARGDKDVISSLQGAYKGACNVWCGFKLVYQLPTQGMRSIISTVSISPEGFLPSILLLVVIIVTVVIVVVTVILVVVVVAIIGVVIVVTIIGVVVVVMIIGVVGVVVVSSIIKLSFVIIAVTFPLILLDNPRLKASHYVSSCFWYHILDLLKTAVHSWNFLATCEFLVLPANTYQQLVAGWLPESESIAGCPNADVLLGRL
ncbi:hypothetical protein Tco_0454639 [Tanacetum coccineum]